MTKKKFLKIDVGIIFSLDLKKKEKWHKNKKVKIKLVIKY